MKLQIMSDLHTEGYIGSVKNLQPIQEGVDVLVLAGDIFTIRSMGFVANWLASLPENLHKVYVPGNHEYYRSSFEEMDGLIKSYFLDVPNFHYLQRDSVRIEGVTFIGATLWTRLTIPDYQSLWPNMMDFHVIKDMDMALWNKRHQDDYNFIVETLKETRGEKRIVVTHHTPSLNSCHPRWRSSNINCGFHADCHALIKNEMPDVWIHGHTHDDFDYVLHGTRVICNPRGYGTGDKKEVPGKYVVKVVEV